MLLLLFLGFAAGNTCSVYKCHDPGVDFGQTCLKKQGDEYAMQLCTDPEFPYCNQVSDVESICSATDIEVIVEKYPGEPCVLDSDCLSGVCSNLTCLGKSQGETCYSNSDCGVGLYCELNNTCVGQKGVNSSCSSDFECGNSYGCDKPANGDGRCVLYYSFPIGNITQNCTTEVNEGKSRLCVTGTCLQIKYGVNGPGICSKNAVSISPNSICTQDSDCKGVMGGGFYFNSTCRCGFSQYGNGFCMTFSGDPVGSRVYTKLRKHFSSPAITKCHTVIRASLACMQFTLSSSELASMTKDMLALTRPADYLENDYCSEILINEDYFGVTEADMACPAYICSESDGSACTYLDESVNTYYLKPCSDVYDLSHCNVSSTRDYRYLNVSCEEPPEESGKLPGESCDNNSTCLSGLCQSAVCVGKDSGEYCELTSECDVGLTCVGVCKPLLSMYEDGCRSDFDCNVLAGCYFSSGETIGSCMPYFSVNLNEYVPCNENGVNVLCRTGTCGKDSSGKSYCTLPFTNIDSFPLICQSDSDCVGSNARAEMANTTCQCGYNPYGRSYCKPFTGDPPAVSFLALLQELVNSGFELACHTNLRLTEFCLKRLAFLNHKSVAEAVQAYYNFTDYGLFIDNEDCVKTMINRYYWGLKPDPDPQPPEPDTDDNTENMGVFLQLFFEVFLIYN